MAVIIATVSEIAKKYTLLGGLIAAMPITTLLSITWIYLDKKDSAFTGINLSSLAKLKTVLIFKKERIIRIQSILKKYSG
ncbi:MAG: hypothetical protein WC197_02605 [Candidatus Gastranaerophilaceae bacterium]